MSLSLESSFLGILQGLTEFFPISSSAHLVIAQKFFPRLAERPLVLEIILHLSTLFALIFFFRQDIKKTFSQPKKLLPIISATITTIIVVLPFKDLIEKTFNSVKFVGAMLIITAIFLFLASRKKDNQKEEVDLKTAIKIGIAQAFATLPGISRSGITISVGMLSGLKTLTAFKFSFLLAIFIIAGSGIFKLFDLSHTSTQLMKSYFLGFIFSFLTGVFALKFLIKKISLNQRNLFYFGLYCLIIGLITFSFLS